MMSSRLESNLIIALFVVRTGRAPVTADEKTQRYPHVRWVW